MKMVIRRPSRCQKRGEGVAEPGHVGDVLLDVALDHHLPGVGHGVVVALGPEDRNARPRLGRLPHLTGDDPVGDHNVGAGGGGGT